MTRYLKFTSAVALQTFVFHQARHWADWRSLELWREPDDGLFVLGVPDTVKLRPADEQMLVGATLSGPGVAKCCLGELWRFARPVRRSSAERDAPFCWMLLLQGAQSAACDQLVEAAPDGFELLDLHSSDAGGQRMFGCIVRGEAGRMLAHTPPDGVTAFECDELPGRGRAALPIGWSAPRMLGELWPQGSDRFVVYWRGPDDAFRTQEFFVADQIPLAQLVEAEPTVIHGLEDLTRDIRPARWRVVRHSIAGSEEPRDLDSVECWRVVFRVKTYDSGADPLASGDWRGHELGHAFLQVLDECEAGLLPEMLYSAVDISEAERWHLLYTDRADNHLLDAWSMLDRFDLVPEAAECGLNVYVSASSRMIPPIAAMLSSVASRGEVVDRIKVLVGSPAQGDLVLIEDLETAGAASAEEWGARTVNPRVIHLCLAKAKPLAELLPRLVSNWNNAEPMLALAQSSEPEYVRELRHAHEERLNKIAFDEENALRSASELTQQSLAEWAAKAAAAISSAAAPVRDARDVCTELVDALAVGAASFDQACLGLSRFFHELTKPRRDWIIEQMRKNTQAVVDAVPIAGEAGSVRAAAETMQAELDGQSMTLRHAIEAIEALEPRLAASESEADAASAAAQRASDRVVARAESAMQRIEGQVQSTRANLIKVQEQQRRVQGEQRRLEAMRDQVVQQERENLRLHESNEELAEAVRQRVQDAVARRKEIERIRVVEIPRLESEAAEAHKRLAELNPAGLAARHQRVVAEYARVETALREATVQLAAVSEMEEKMRADRALVDRRRAEHEEAKAAHQRAQDELEAFGRNLKASISELDKRRVVGDLGDLDARCRIARQALEDIRGPLRRRGVLARVWRAIVGRQP